MTDSTYRHKITCGDISALVLSAIPALFVSLYILRNPEMWMNRENVTAAMWIGLYVILAAIPAANSNRYILIQKSDPDHIDIYNKIGILYNRTKDGRKILTFYMKSIYGILCVVTLSEIFILWMLYNLSGSIWGDTFWVAIFGGIWVFLGGLLIWSIIRLEWTLWKCTCQ